MCKNYYFADNCDLLHSFLDFNRAELDKPATMVISEHVQSGWENALRTFPPFIDGKHRVQCYQAEFSLTEQLQRIISSSESGSGRLTDTTPTRGLDLLSIKIDFEFPDTLIFNRENLAKYELLFRLIFRLVDLSRELNGPSDLSSAPRGLRKSFLILRRQMLHFVQNMHQYLIYEVIEPQWSTLTEAISAATGMDSIVQLHTQFIDACLRQAMLTNAKLVQIANVLFTQCQRLLSIKTEGLNSTDAQARLSTTQSAFNKTMRMFLEALQYYSSRDYDYHLGTLFSRLDYCSFYYATSFGADAMNGSTTGGVTDRRSTLGASSIL
jgi:gamma-tubulin complex component 2